jgi:hypothetical protein
MDFLESHQGVRKQLLGHPYWFIRREHRYDEFKSFSKSLTRVQLDHFDSYLNQHPGLAAEIRKNPKLLDNPDFLANHRQFQVFLAAHPGLEAQILQHPAWFMTRDECESGRPAADLPATQPQPAS